MLVEIRGTGFVNKGAELMLRAAVQEVRNAFPDVWLAVTPSVMHNDYLKRAGLCLYQKLSYHRLGIQWGRLGGIIPARLRCHYGIVTDEEVNVLLDASGFSYSDQWGPDATVNMASDVKRWKRNGTRVILLPQALGPFTSPKIRKAFSYIACNADLVFARDEVSYGHVVDLVGRRDNVRQAPDFTNLLPGTKPDDADRFKGRFCLIPNCRMVDKVSHEDGRQYPSFCAVCLCVLAEAGGRPFILIHEGHKDRSLAERIVAEAGIECAIVQEEDALRIKGILGLCEGVVSSRFHGLVSALSQGVPALATGWSHKYETLLNDYGVADGCLPVSVTRELLEKHIHRIVDGSGREEVLGRIRENAARLKEGTQAMWQKVLSVMGRE